MALAGLYRVTQDLEGNAITGVLGTVTLSGTATLATLYGDAEGTLPLPNPTSNNAQYGSFNLFLVAGTYDMQFVKSGYVFETQRNITLRDPNAGVNTLTGTANRVIVSPVPGVGAVTLSTPQDIAPDSAVQFGAIGVGEPPQPASFRLLVQPGNCLIRGALAINQNTLPTQPLEVNGSAIVTNLGIGTAPIAPTYSLVVANNTLMQGSLGVAGAVPVYPLVVGGTGAQITQLGLGTGPNASYSLVAAFTALFQGSVGINNVPPTYPLQVSGAAAKTGGGNWVDPTSSRVLKRNIRPLVGALAALLAVQGRQWEWAEDQPELEQQLPGTRTGLVIEEVQEKRPEWIALDSEGKPGLWTVGLEALVIEALRELVQRLEAVEDVCATP